jgi:hypothetical protein
MAMQ